MFKKKTEADELRYKARLCAKKFTQRYELNYQDIYASVINMRTLRVLLAMAANLDLDIHQMDIKTVFLNSYLSSEKRISMKLSKRYNSFSSETTMLLLERSIYDLKQASFL